MKALPCLRAGANCQWWSSLFLASFFLFLLSPRPAAQAQTQVEQSLEVHEWGTITVLNGSNGTVIPWYQPQSDLSELPDFVERFLGMSKAGIGKPWAVRMETPVLYFYPEGDAPLSVRVRARMTEGAITEVFPRARTVWSERSALWKGQLLPPGHALGAQLPAAAEGGQHYLQARDVKEAWLFEAQPETKGEAEEGMSSLPLKIKQSVEGQIDRVPQVDRFVFYRGAGSSGPPLNFSTTGNTLYPMTGQATVWRDLVVLRIADGRAGWEHVRPDEGAERLPQMAIPATTKPVDEVVAELEREFHPMLTQRGLSAAEATAMIRTWRDLWFREPGLRVFAPLPRAWIDTVVPLEIEPKPRQMKRVFIGRWEIFTPEQEREGLTLLRDAAGAEGESKIAPATWAELKLGRFENGFVQRLIDLESRRLWAAHSRLRSEARLP